VLVEGAAGLGKSRLLLEVARRASDRSMKVLRGRAPAAEGDFPFAVAVRLFEGPLARAGESERNLLFEGAAGLARPLLVGQHGVEGDDGRPVPLSSTLHGLYWLAVNLAQRGPLLVCVDDLHWSDELSLRFLLYLASRLEELPIALVMSARPPGAEGDGESLAQLRATRGARRLGLCPLKREGVASLVRASLPQAEEEFCVVCAEVTRGNPFYVREVLLTVVEEEGLSATAGSAGRLRALVGASIAQAALFRLVGAGADAVALGRALAVLGDGAPLRQVAALAQLDFDAAAAAADALVDEDVLAPGELLAFAHSLIRDQVYRESPAQHRGIWHLRAARLLADEGAVPERVAAQLLLAPSTGDPWVVGVLRAAAQRARGEGAPGAAARYLQRALEEPAPSESRCALLVDLGAAEAAAGSGDAAVEHLTVALELEVDPGARAQIWRSLSGALAGAGQTQAAADALEQAIAEGTGRDLDTTYVLLADYLTTAMFEPGLRQRAFERAAPLLSASPSGSTAVERRLLAVMAMRSAQEAEPAQRAIELAGRAWGNGALLVDEGPDGPGWLMVCWALELAEDYTRARAVTSAAIDAARRLGSVHAFANASYFHGDSCYRQGHLADAQADAEQAIEAHRAGWRRYLVAALVLKANVLVERDELDAAEEALAIAEVHERASMFEHAWYQHARGRLELARSRPREALGNLEQAGRWLSEQLLVEHTLLPWRADAAQAALAIGDRERARALIEPSLAPAERAGTRVLHGRRLRVLGLVEGGERGIELLQQSEQRLTGTQALLEHAYALADLGGALRRAGRRSDSRPVLQGALDAAHRLGARRLEARARDELVTAGARPRRSQISGADALTPSEQRVARLAVQGMSNPQIAQALFVTPKTVEFHLRHVYQKLDISGRAKLAAALGAPQHSSQEPTAKD
jgi:DNA-binding CsgD family transcriptional regulator